MRPRFLDEEGERTSALIAGLSAAQLSARCAAEAEAYRRTRRRVHLDRLWDLVYGFVLSLPTRRSYVLVGYPIEEALADAYIALERAAATFDVGRGVPFVAFFSRKLWGHMAGRRISERREWDGAEPLDEGRECGTASNLFDGGDLDSELMGQLEDGISGMDAGYVSSLAMAYVRVAREGKRPSGMVLSAYSGIPLRRLGRASLGLPCLLRKVQAIGEQGAYSSGRKVWQGHRELWD